jgi:hypothetical protein
MATLTQQTEFAAWIDRSLEYLIEEWSEIPEIACEWSTWDEPDRLDFVLEWPLNEIRLRDLQTWEAQGRLSAAQRKRFEELERLIRRHRTTLDRLLAE